MRRLVVVMLGMALLAALAAPSQVLAGTAGRWERFTPTNQSNIDEFALHRTSDSRLHVLWQRHDTVSSDSLVHRSIGRGGTLGAVDAVVTNWAAVGNPDVVADGDGMRVFFGGIRSGDPDETYGDLATATAPTSGASWTLAGELAARGDYAYASDIGAVNAADGTPFQTWGSTAGLMVHRGLTPGTNHNYQTQLGRCCGYSPDLAVDGSTGRMWVAWHSNAETKEGVWVNEVNTSTGAPVGAGRRMPGSWTNFNGSPHSSYTLDRTPIVSRPGKAGVYVAYPGGYPTTTKALVWKIGAASSQVVGRASDGIVNMSLAATPNGRLWAMWSRQVNGKPRIYARRSNTAATRWGETVSVPSPSGSAYMFKMAGDAQNGVLDVVGLFQGAGDAHAGWHTQIKPGLTLGATPLRFEGRRTVTFRVRDAGVAVAGAVVKAGSRTVRTDSEGVATMTFGPYASRTRLPVVATKAGYVRDRVVLVARPS